MSDPTLLKPRSGSTALGPSDAPGVRIFVPVPDEAAPTRDPLRRRLVRRIAAWSGALLSVYWIAAFTATHVPMPPGGGPGPFGIPHFDKLVHAGIYAGLALLLTSWLAVRKRFGKAVKYAVIVGLVLGAYGGLDEITQSYLPFKRTTDLADWLADLAGISLGLAAFFRLRAWVRR